MNNKKDNITLLNEQYFHSEGVLRMTAASSSFERHYIDIREKEGRILADEAVLKLPDSPLPAFRQEWAYRRFATAVFLPYLKKQVRGNILDLGCGNGWFSKLLTLNNSNTVLGLDINMPELEQAVRLFGSDHCRFAYGDIFEVDIPAATYQYIVINSAVQYFPDLPHLLQRLLYLLTPQGEIHLLDSPFYDQTAIAAASLRTKSYYENAGTPEMAAFYHHHSWENLEDFKWKLMYNPNHWWHKIKRKAGYPCAIFPWIRIKHPI
jgi:SAM-dependent methyltransferase